MEASGHHAVFLFPPQNRGLRLGSNKAKPRQHPGLVLHAGRQACLSAPPQSCNPFTSRCVPPGRSQLSTAHHPHKQGPSSQTFNPVHAGLCSPEESPELQDPRSGPAPLPAVRATAYEHGGFLFHLTKCDHAREPTTPARRPPTSPGQHHLCPGGSCSPQLSQAQPPLCLAVGYLSGRTNPKLGLFRQT